MSNYVIYMAFFYYINTKPNNSEFKKVMRRFKIEYHLKQINLFDRKYTFIKIINQEEYFQKLLTLEILSFRVHGSIDIFIYNPDLNTSQT